MTASDVTRTVWRENIPYSVLLELTYRCNLDCYFCYNDRGLKGRPLSLAQYRSLLTDLAGLGCLYVSLSGGEPLAHPDFWEIGGAARERGFVVRLKTNGHALRPRVAKRLREEIDPYIVEMSLHGATAAVHDRQTRVPGSFSQLLANIEAMRELGLRMQLNSTLTRWNENEVEAMYQLADRYSVRLQVDPTVTPRDNGDRDTLSVHASVEGVRRWRQILAVRTNTGEQPREAATEQTPASSRPEKFCGAGSGGGVVDPYGNVYPCVQWRVPAGSLHTQGIREIWENSPALREVRSSSFSVNRFVEHFGPGGQMMHFCPGLARQYTGSPTQLYPSAEINLQAAKPESD